MPKTDSSSRQKKSRSSRKGERPLKTHYKKTLLANGVRIVTEKHPASRAVSCGFMITRGTRDELANEAGLAHFIEHMVFKRTQKRTAFQISRDMEAVGGDLNAFTSRETTTFVTYSLSEDLALSLDVLSDLVARPKFELGDIKKEKQVVIQEIHMSEEQLEDSIFDRFFEMAFPESPVGKPILGSVKSISGIKRETLLDFYHRQYCGENIVVAVTGNVDHNEVVKQVRKHLVLPSRPAPRGRPQAPATQPMRAFRDVVKRPSEQAHMLIGLPSTDFRSRLRFEGYIVNSLLGGGMTSRLYQKVREERGLVYSIYSQLIAFVDMGMMLIYAGTEPKKAPEVVDLTLKEIRRLKRHGMKKAELQLFKTQVKGQILLGADDVDSRMNSIASNEMVFGKYRSVEDVMRDFDRVSLDSVHEYIETFMDEERMGILLMGQLPEEPTRKWLRSL